MQEPGGALESPHGASQRRGKRLPPIQTTFVPDPIQNVQRPPPVETVIYKTSPERPMLTVDAPVTNRRASKNFLGLFNRSKSVRDFQSQDLSNIILESDEYKGRNHSYSSGMSSSKVSESKPKKSTSTRKERPQRSVMTWDPLPLFQAYSQAVKYSTLPAPTASADSILKSDKYQQSRRKSDFTVLDNISYGNALSLGEDGQEEGNKLRRGGLGSSALHWTAKTFVLTPLGFLLQYAGSGHHDRLPEKIMQLTSDSAAFASDAIPGKHWVLQVTSSFSEDGVVAAAPSKSVFSKLRGETKRYASNFLLVMESAEDMNSWLVAVRKEIQALGGQSYRPDEITKKDPIQQLQQKPSRRFLIQKSSDSTITQEEASPKDLSREKEISSRTDHDLSGSLERPFLWHTETGMSEASQSTVRANLPSQMEARVAWEPQNPLQINSKDVSSISSPPSNPESVSLLKWELPSNFTPSFSGTALGFASGMDLDLRRESMSSVPSLSSQGRSHRSLSEHSDTPAPNFSLPKISHRLSHSVKSGSTITPPTSSGSTYRTAPPIHAEGNTIHVNASIDGELPMIVANSTWDSVNDASEVGIAISHDPSEWEDMDELPPLAAPTYKAPPPKRFSSLENRYSLFPPQNTQDAPSKEPDALASELPSPRRHSAMDFPSAHTRPVTPKKSERRSYLPPPHPPPTSALPALPPNATPAMGSSSSNPSPKLRRPASMQIRPSSRSNAPGYMASTQPNASLAIPMTVRERRSFMGRPPSHLLGPPVAPPPSNPLPDIPQASHNGANVDNWKPSNSKMEMVHA
ncbi:hypothetical protein MMC10_002436 [Thelotrema lepadinum]|nr:hypothetical protein [Thelotrema lepadinum]